MKEDMKEDMKEAFRRMFDAWGDIDEYCHKHKDILHDERYAVLYAMFSLKRQFNEAVQ